jgi:hypothetical protein
MAETADMVAYRQEWVLAFQRRQSLIRQTVTTEAQTNGNSAVFAVTGNNADIAVTRTINGMIPYNAVTNNQYTAVLAEKHAPYSTTAYNFFAAQADMRRALQIQGVATINREVDSAIITELGNATQDANSSTAEGSLDLTVTARTILLNNQVELDGQITFLITPAYEAYMLQTPEFANSQWRSSTPLNEPQANPVSGNMYTYAGLKWIVHNGLPGIGTNAEKCYMYHRSAIGHAIRNGDPQTSAGYWDMQQTYWFNGTVFHGAKLLQNSGVVVVTHDGSAFVAT